MPCFSNRGRLAGPFFIAVLMALPVLAVAAEPLLPLRVERSRVVTPTRFITLLHGLSYDLIDALRAGDRATLDRLLAADFEQRSGAAPTQPVPRAEWLQGTALKANGAVRIVDMAVHDHGELAIASYRMALDGPRQLQFVVDVWRRKGDDYELQTRYVSDLPLPAPGAVPPPRPDGKR
jgi:hypothetical protein